MKGSRGLNKYRAIDLTLFAVMLYVFECIMVTASTRWFPNEPYTVSVSAAITAIVMMRWGPWAAIHALLGGLALCVSSGAEARQYLVYCVGNLFALGALGLRRWMGEEAIRTDALKTLLFGLCTAVLMEAGRALVSLLLGVSPPVALGFFTTDVITVLFTLVIVWIVRRLDGVWEDQRHYLLRLEAEQKKERGGY